MTKARAWLNARGVDHAFHDYRTHGIERAVLAGWVDAHGWDVVLNRAGTTFRRLPEVQRQGIDREGAIALMLAQPSMIKRPVLDLGDRVLIGFKPDLYAEAMGG